MGNWDSYKREENERASAITGKRRVVITEATEGVTGVNSKVPGTPQIIIKLRPSGCKFTLTSRIQKDDRFNRRMTEFFDAFPDVGDGNFNFIEWVGCEGAAMLKEGNNGYTEVAYFLDPVRAADLPPFEGDKPKKQTIIRLDDDGDTDDELPFDL